MPNHPLDTSVFFKNGQPITYEQFLHTAVDPQQHITVEACAGSGKTWLLVTRIIRALLAGVQPGQIIAITFTRKAAFEMEQRVHELLQELESAEPEEVERALMMRGLTQEEVRHQMSDIRQLRSKVLFSGQPIAFRTFHAWFAEIVAQAPLGASVLRAAELTEHTQEIVETAWMRWLERLSYGKETELRTVFERVVATYGYDLLKKIGMNFLKDVNVDWQVWCWEHSAPVEAVMQKLTAELAEDLAGESWDNLATDDRFIENLRLLSRTLALGSSADQEKSQALNLVLACPSIAVDQLTRCLTHLMYTDKGTERKTIATKTALKKGGEAVEQFIEDLRVRVSQAFNRQRAEHSLASQRDLFILFADFVPTYQLAKQQQGVYDFSDLELEAVRLLESEDIAAAMHSRYETTIRHLLIDEFQDTNPMQWRAVRAWLDPYLHGETGTDAPKVFLVGDPKQSIYRFRRAEPRLFGIAQEFLQTTFSAPVLATNLTRRCSQAVVDSLNQSLLGNFPHFALHQTSSLSTGAVNKYARIEGAAEDKEEEVADAELEAEALAQAVWRSKQQLRSAPDTNESASYEWSDILILLKARTQLPYIEFAFRQAGIPYFSDRQGALMHTLEAQDIMALLRLLFMPWDDLSLMHTLRMPIFRADTQMIAALMQVEGVTGIERLAQLRHQNEQFATWYEQLKEWEGLAKKLPVHDLLDHVYAQTSLLVQYAQSVDASMQKKVVANLQRLLYLSLDVQGGRYPSPHQLFAYLQDQMAINANESEGEAIVEVGNVVRIMTVHAAKGLEAPIVILAFTNQGDKPDSGVRALVEWPPHSRAPVTIRFILTNESKDRMMRQALENHAALGQQEDWNKLYVAMTRAQEQLLVLGSGKEKERSWYQRIAANIISNELDASISEQQSPVQQSERPVERLESIAEFLPQPLSVGQIDAAEEERDQGKAMGQLMHWYLEEYWQSLDDDSVLQASRAQAILLGLSMEQQRLAWQAAQNILAGSGAQWFDGSAVWEANELEVWSAAGKQLRIDRLVETSEAVWVIDFKIRMHSEEQAAYEHQVRQYVAAVQTSFPNKPVYGVLLIGDDGRVHYVKE